MRFAASVLRWGFLAAGSFTLVTFLATAARLHRKGARFGELVEVMERGWFSAGTVFFAVLSGLAGSWAAGQTIGTPATLTESVPALFPMALVAAYAFARFAAPDDSPPLRAKVVFLVAAPLICGAVLTGW
ncbi:hypothetical protein [Streptomyces syringium]|uniref:hypothetical protein n=1 Tax=Streptomyces syringium TaxID=76729 RepID=UPI0034480E23